jgi:hypothetical protein
MISELERILNIDIVSKFKVLTRREYSLYFLHYVTGICCDYYLESSDTRH